MRPTTLCTECRSHKPETVLLPKILIKIKNVEQRDPLETLAQSWSLLLGAVALQSDEIRGTFWVALDYCWENAYILPRGRAAVPQAWCHKEETEGQGAFHMGLSVSMALELHQLIN